MNYHLFLSTKRIRPDNKAPVYVKIFINNKAYERCTGVYIEPKYWNRDFKRADVKHANATEVNNLLNIFEAKLNTKCSINECTITFIDSILKPKSTNSANITCVDAINALIKHKEKLIDTADGICNETFKSYFHKAKNINEFLQNELNKPGLLLTDFNYSIGEKLKAYLLTQNFGIPHINRHIKQPALIIKNPFPNN